VNKIAKMLAVNGKKIAVILHQVVKEAKKRLETSLQAEIPSTIRVTVVMGLFHTKMAMPGLPTAILAALKTVTALKIPLMVLSTLRLPTGVMDLIMVKLLVA
jgi:hypothetical protein